MSHIIERRPGEPGQEGAGTREVLGTLEAEIPAQPN